MKYVKLSKLPVIGALLIVITWHYFGRHLCVSRNDANFIETWASIIGTAHSILASLITQRVMDKDSHILKAKRLKDKEAFDYYKLDRIPNIIKGFLGLLSLNIIFLCMSYPFESERIALFANFTVTFTLLGWWVIATELDDPFSGVWIIDKHDLPEGWTIN